MQVAEILSDLTSLRVCVGAGFSFCELSWLTTISFPGPLPSTRAGECPPKYQRTLNISSE